MKTQRALLHMIHLMMREKEVRIRTFRLLKIEARMNYGGSSSSRSTAEQNPGTNLHIAGLDPLTREKDIKTACERFGRVLDCKLIMDPRTGLYQLNHLLIHDFRNVKVLRFRNNVHY